MTTHQNTSKSKKFRTFLRYAWGESVTAHRAMMRTQPYDDYLFNHRSEY
jgi:hypothetical protein